MANCANANTVCMQESSHLLTQPSLTPPTCHDLLYWSIVFIFCVSVIHMDPPTTSWILGHFHIVSLYRGSPCFSTCAFLQFQVRAMCFLTDIPLNQSCISWGAGWRVHSEATRGNYKRTKSECLQRFLELMQSLVIFLVFILVLLASWHCTSSVLGFTWTVVKWTASCSRF